MPVEEALSFFEHIPKIRRRLETLNAVGPGLHPPRPAGDHALGRRGPAREARHRALEGGDRRTLYILDEPTTGLHFADVQRLLEVLQRLVDAGNSVVVIEHNLDVIKCADRLIDMGPEGGEEGGMVIAAGTPEEVAGERASHTGEFLSALRSCPPTHKPNGRASAEGKGWWQAKKGRRPDGSAGNGRLAQSRKAAKSARRAGVSWTPSFLSPFQGALWAQKWRWYERNSLPWNRARSTGSSCAARRSCAGRCTATCSRRCARDAWRSGRERCSSPACGSPRRERARADRRGHVPEPGRDGGGRAARGDRRALHARQRLLRDRREPPLRRSTSRSPGRASRARGPPIGDNCWLGANVVVTSGVSIGERCVIGANSVVTNDIEPFSIAAGAPARVCCSSMDRVRRVAVAS